MKNELSYRTAMLIREIHSLTAHSMEESVRESGLTVQQILVVKLLGHKGELTISRLCEEMNLTKGTVSGIITRLEEKGYVEKNKKDQDRRETYVRFSEMGLQFAKAFRIRIEKSYAHIFEGIDEAEMESFIRNLTVIRDRVAHRDTP